MTTELPAEPAAGAAAIPSRGGAREVQRARAGATRAALLAAGRALFTDPGYHATGTAEIVVRAAVTRGALYHHFSDKEHLFEAVFRDVQRELNETARAAAITAAGGTWARTSEGLKIYLRLIAAHPAYQRILLLDGPAVLGWRRWRDLHAEWVAAGIAVSLTLLMDQGIIARGPREPLAHLIQAALHDAALGIAHDARSDDAVGAYIDAFGRLLDGLKLA